jgi:hypothetical protein
MDAFGQIVLYHDNRYGSAQIGLLVGNTPDRANWGFCQMEGIPDLLDGMGISGIEGQAVYFGRIPRILAN